MLSVVYMCVYIYIYRNPCMYRNVNMCNYQTVYIHIISLIDHYCQSLTVCSTLYSHFLHTLRDDSYYPRGAEPISDNRLFSMYHSCTDEHNKPVIMESFRNPDGVVRVVFATMALGMGVDFKSLDFVIHYGAPRSIDDYFQESGRAGRDHQPSQSKIYWKPVEAPRYIDQTVHRNREIKAVRQYLENTSICRKFMLLDYFDSVHESNHSTRTCLPAPK